MAEYAYECLNNNMTEVSTGEIKFLHVDYVSKIREKPDYALVVKAKEVSALWQATGNHAQAMAVANSSEIHSVYHANAIGWLYSRKDTEQVLKLKAVAIGDAIGFVTFPGEAFDTISVAVEERSPYDFTVFLGYAVQHLGYLPNEAAWEYGCYEADITNYCKGDDKLIEDQYITMLEGLYNS